MRYLILVFAGLMSLCFSHASLAHQSTTTTNTPKIVIHVNNGTKRTYKAALSYAKIFRERYGNKLKLEIISNSTGVGLVNAKNTYKLKVKGLLQQGVKFSVCNNTLTKIRKHKNVPIVEGVDIVPFGILKVIELQSKGYLYINP